jgi:Holliday junction resolvasome RuvABC endonuclease subunit
MVVLALDIGTTTGWCIDDGASRRWGSWDLAAAGITRAHRIDRLSRHLTAAHRDHGYQTVVCEVPYAGTTDGMQSIRLMLGLLGMVELASLRLGALVIEMNPASIKKAILGWTARKHPAGGKKRIVAKGADVHAALAARGLDIVDEHAAMAVAMMIIHRGEERAYVPAPGAERPARKARGAAVMARVGGAAVAVPRHLLDGSVRVRRAADRAR